MKLMLNVVLFIFLLALGNASFAEGRNLQSIIESGELRVGISQFTPWVIKAKNGVYMGSEPDMARRLADDMGVKTTFVEHDWNQLIPALKKGSIDIIISGMAVTPSRALQVNFSNSYGESGIGLASHIEKTKHIKSMEDLQNSEISIAVVAGTNAEELSKRLFKSANIQPFASFKEASEAIVNGKVHVIVGSSTEMKFLSLRHPEVIDKPLTKPLLNSYEAFAVRKGDYDFVNFLNAWILARQADAWLTSTRYYWFNTLRWQGLVE